MPSDTFIDALSDWTLSALRIESLETIDLWELFDGRDLLRREIMSGRDLSEDNAAFLSSADEVYACHADTIIPALQAHDWLADLPADHYAHAFVAQHSPTAA
jgi:hypothetical protein